MYNIYLFIIYIYIYEQDFALKDFQELICRKTQPTNLISIITVIIHVQKTLFLPDFSAQKFGVHIIHEKYTINFFPATYFLIFGTRWPKVD